MKKKNRLLIKRNTSQKKNMGAKAMQFVLQHRGKFTGVCVWEVRRKKSEKKKQFISVIWREIAIRVNEFDSVMCLCWGWRRSSGVGVGVFAYKNQRNECREWKRISQEFQLQRSLVLSR